MSTELYQRPDRAKIAAGVLGQLPGAKPPPQPPRPVTNVNAAFAAHVAAALRKTGWTQKQLCERAGVDDSAVSKLLDGRPSRPSLALAAAVADALSFSLDAMTRPYACGTCEGAPPAGYACLECGTEGERL